MQLISEDYRSQQRKMHQIQSYGSMGGKYAKQIAEVMNAYGVEELLDYGAGKLSLIKAISDGRLVDHNFRYYPYEPADEEHSEAPEPSDMVVCIDVLEHIEPELLDNVLDDLQRVTQWIGFFTVSIGPANKTLPDGRNAHLIQEPAEWWLPKIMQRFELHNFQKRPDGFSVLVGAK